ncbi:hypothetical protein Tco_0675036 [Tanacetum coccineum]
MREESCNSEIKISLSSVSAWRVSISTSMSSSRAITSSGLSPDVSDAGLPSEKGPRLVLVSIELLGEVGCHSLLRMECTVVASCSGELSEDMSKSVGFKHLNLRCSEVVSGALARFPEVVYIRSPLETGIDAADWEQY